MPILEIWHEKDDGIGISPSLEIVGIAVMPRRQQCIKIHFSNAIGRNNSIKFLGSMIKPMSE